MSHEQAAARKTNDGLIISASSVKRLERELISLNESYDSLRISQLTNYGKD